jgi:hypothetical protein
MKIIIVGREENPRLGLVGISYFVIPKNRPIKLKRCQMKKCVRSKDGESFDIKYTMSVLTFSNELLWELIKALKEENKERWRWINETSL